jgi:hypothetical protein
MGKRKAMTPIIGNLYRVPSGMGGVFIVRVVAYYDETRQGDGTYVPARVYMRVHMPNNKSWHNYVFTLNRDYFEQEAKEVENA